MDSKEVTKEINKVIRPTLRANGFDKFSGRTYWKYAHNRIDIINFLSFNSYNADVVGCTTFSFAVNLATYLNFIPSVSVIKEKNGLKRPLEYEGHFRTPLNKGIKQKELAREDIWFIDENGNNLNAIVLDCKNQIIEKAFNWFEQFDKNENILQILLKEPENMKKLWGFGNFDSPRRNKFTAYKFDLAIEKFKKCQEFYQAEYDKVKDDYYSRGLAERYAKELGKIADTIKEIKNY